MKTKIFCDIADFKTIKFFNNKSIVDGFTTNPSYWDFSAEGRKRQAIRMNKLATVFLDQGFNVVADFVCPTPGYRKLFDPDHVIWVNTIEKSKFEDTNQFFIKPKEFDIEIKTKNSDY